MSPAIARRAALAAQGFAGSPPTGAVTRRHLLRTLDRVQLLQLDSVNVAVRAHHMPLFSRLGPYDRALVDDAAWAHSSRRPRLLVEYWAHEASLLPVADWPLLLTAAKSRGWWRHYGALAEQQPALVDDVLAAVKELGPVGAGELEQALGGTSRPRPPGASWWERSDVKRICEYLFGLGQLTTGARRHFQRLYDLPERVLPPQVLARPPVEDAVAARTLVLRSASALGVATEPDLRDYYRLAPARSQAAVAELVDAGALTPVQVRGWRHLAYRAPDAPGAQADHRSGAAVPVRPADLGARPHRAAVRLPLPHRDLRARAQAAVRLLRVPVPAGRRAGRQGRPQGRPGRRGAAGARRVQRARRRGAPGGGRTGGGAARRWPSGWGWTEWWWGSAATWPARSPPRSGPADSDARPAPRCRGAQGSDPGRPSVPVDGRPGGGGSPIRRPGGRRSRSADPPIRGSTPIPGRPSAPVNGRPEGGGSPPACPMAQSALHGDRGAGDQHVPASGSPAQARGGSAGSGPVHRPPGRC